MPDDVMTWHTRGEAFRDRIKDPLLFRAYMLVKMPVLGVTGTYFDRVDLETIEAVQPPSFTTRNLFGRTFDAAVYAAAETTSAALMTLHIRNQEAEFTPHLVCTRTEMLAPAAGPLRFLAGQGEAYAHLVVQAIEEGEAEGCFTVDVLDSAGTATHRIELTWSLRPKI